MLDYCFGPKHPLKPERLRRTISLLEACVPDLAIIDPGLAREEDLLLVHDAAYVEDVAEMSRGGRPLPHRGFGSLDNPVFLGMHEASLAYCGGTIRAAEAICAGEMLAFNIAGGLHHAQRGKASGFCIYNDVALACSLLRQRFSRVIYLDIDLHHGDGVEEIFRGDDSVITYSVHQDGRTLYPGTGSLASSSLDAVNVPLAPGTTGEVWLRAVRETLPLVGDYWKPEAVVLQMGTDAHRRDPLGHLEALAEHWLEAVRLAISFGLPIHASGGGGYSLQTVPRMWTAAILTLAGRPLPESIPDSIPAEWGLERFLDHEVQEPKGLAAAEEAISFWRQRFALG